MRIDAHHHVWDLTVRDQPWTRDLPVLRRTFTASELRPALRRNAIDATVLVQTIAAPEETPELLSLAAEDSHVRAVVGWTSLTDPAIADRLAQLRELPGASALVGIRHGIQDETEPDWPARPEVRRGIKAVGAAGLAYDLLVRPDQLPAAVRTVRELPDVRFVLDHAGNPVIGADGLTPWTSLLTELADCPNVAVKLSGLVTRTGAAPARALRPYADVLLATVGSDRLMYGSDWPVCLLAAEYDDVLAVAETLTDQLSADEREAVFGTTAARWYGIAP
ncbi:amidohydrolase family protein [Streptomyces sp. NBC_01455]|uniref:amidohydrolase family protein n=1 Tax=Streptomyces sp. NBC_01455 TaxID=2903874 RepID=UPI002E3680E7|nr:amidohydrolase family protein [Streptomyces sp. NBC_01455]